MVGGKLRPYGSPNVGHELFRCAEHAFPCHSHLLGKGPYLGYTRISQRFLFGIAACCTFSVRNLLPLKIRLELRLRRVGQVDPRAEAACLCSRLALHGATIQDWCQRSDRMRASNGSDRKTHRSWQSPQDSCRKL